MLYFSIGPCLDLLSPQCFKQPFSYLVAVYIYTSRRIYSYGILLWIISTDISVVPSAAVLHFLVLLLGLILSHHNAIIIAHAVHWRNCLALFFSHECRSSLQSRIKPEGFSCGRSTSFLSFHGTTYRNSLNLILANAILIPRLALPAIGPVLLTMMQI